MALEDAFTLKARLYGGIAQQNLTTGGIQDASQAIQGLVQAKMAERRAALAAGWAFQNKIDMASQLTRQLGFPVYPGEEPNDAIKRMAGEKARNAQVKAFGEGVGALTPEEKADLGAVDVKRIGGIEATDERAALEKELGPVLAGRDPEAILNDPNLSNKLTLGQAEKLQRLVLARKREARLEEGQERGFEFRDRALDQADERIRLAQAQATALAEHRANLLAEAQKRFALAVKWYERARSEDERREARADLDDARADLNLRVRGVAEMEGNQYMTAAGIKQIRDILDQVGKGGQVVKYGPGEIPPALGGPVKDTAPGGLGGGLGEDDSAPTPLAPGGLGAAPGAPQTPPAQGMSFRRLELARKVRDGTATPAEMDEYEALLKAGK